MVTPSPTSDIHDETGYDCWCLPTYLAVSVDAEEWHGAPVAITRAECETTELPLVVVHNR